MPNFFSSVITLLIAKIQHSGYVSYAYLGKLSNQTLLTNLYPETFKMSIVFRSNSIFCSHIHVHFYIRQYYVLRPICLMSWSRMKTRNVCGTILRYIFAISWQTKYCFISITHEKTFCTLVTHKIYFTKINWQEVA